MRKVLFAALVLAFATASAPAALWNTGVDNSGVALPYGTADPHYSLITVPSGPSTAMAIVPHPDWVAPPPTRDGSHRLRTERRILTDGFTLNRVSM